MMACGAWTAYLDYPVYLLAESACPEALIIHRVSHLLLLLVWLFLLAWPL